MLVNTKTLSLAHLKTCKNMFSDTQNNFCTCYLLILLVSRVLEERFSVNQHLQVNQNYAPIANNFIHFCNKILLDLAKKHGKAGFCQNLECAGLKSWSKYTTSKKLFV